MRHPTDPTIIGDRFGPRAPIKVGGQTSAGFHRGLDYVPPKVGQQVPIYAIADGVVRWTSGIYNQSAGIYAIVEHPGPWRLTGGRVLDSVWVGYCHLSRRSVTAGQSLREGAEIGRMGATGLATGVHLHLDVFDRSPLAAGSFDARVDPLSLIVPNLAGAPAGSAPAKPADPGQPTITVPEEDSMPIIARTTNAKDGAAQYFAVTDGGIAPFERDETKALNAFRQVLTAMQTARAAGATDIAVSVYQLRTYRDYVNRANGRKPFVPDVLAK